MSVVVQVRSHGADDLKDFVTFTEAFEYAHSHDDVWKISWPDGDQRVRLLRHPDRRDCWLYAPLMEEVWAELAEVASYFPPPPDDEDDDPPRVIPAIRKLFDEPSVLERNEDDDAD